MPRIKIKSIYIRNFGTVRSSYVDFPSEGFVFVTGKNKTAEEKFDSICAGKTLLGEAISRCLIGVQGRFSRFGDYAPPATKHTDTYLKLSVDIDGKDSIIELGYKCKELSKSGEALRYTIGSDNPVMLRDAVETRRSLSEIIGVSPTVAAWTVHLNGKKLSFDDLSEANSVSLMMEILNQPPWNQYHKNASVAVDKFNELSIKSKAQLDFEKARLEKMKSDIVLLKKALVAAQQEYDTQLESIAARTAIRNASIMLRKEEIAKYAFEISEKTKEIKRLENEYAEKYAEMEKERCSRYSEVSALTSSYSAAKIEENSIESNIKLARERKSSAKLQYESEEYARLNAEAIKARKLFDEIFSRNLAAEAKHKAKIIAADKAVVQKTKDLHSAEMIVKSAETAYHKERDIPAICPLPGCGKVWPRTNEKQLSDAKQRYDTAIVSLNSAKENLANAELERQAITDFKPEPLVETPAITEVPPWPHGAQFDNEINSLTEQLNVAKQKAVLEAQALIASKAALEEIEEKIKSIGITRKVDDISKSIERYQANIKECETDISRLTEQSAKDVPNNSNLIKATAALETAQESIGATEKSIESLSSEAVNADEFCKVANYWKKAFSPYGIPNMIIEQSVTPLNMAAKKVSLRMTGNTILVSCSTKRSLAGGEDRNELSFFINNEFGSSKFNGASNGESGIVNLIISEALSEIGNMSSRIGYRWYDEVSTSQDKLVRRSIFDYIKTVSATPGFIAFVVDHSPEVSSYADMVLIAEKTKEHGTTYIWA